MHKHFFMMAAVSAGLIAAAFHDVRAQEAVPASEFFLSGAKKWTVASGAHFHTHGWGGSAVGNLNRFVGAEIEILKYADYYQDPPAYANLYTLLLGPRFAYRGISGFAPFTHVLLGATRGGQILLPPYPPGVIPATSSTLVGKTAFTLALGGGLDFRVWRFLWIRVPQVDYLRASFPNDVQNSLRLSFGVVLHSGHAP